MGFKKDIEAIIAALSEKCNFESVQKILVSAHVSPNFTVIPTLEISPTTYTMIGFEAQEVV